ncbi:uncharacterized protein LOC111621615 [Centruroides sculpturatus]|uniref:uncharacterized protein LOC111616139 n=1 Tax=Centruroides sculpturatus TaxID=218467 RepID=UPI000C6D12D0|nr:uncharacterized protein LOC111616139 [Centruroides sculpturatus]XP_023219575.1 uncharacterized protein LOC111621615 [Centruroides sculpturatus]
MANIFYEIGRKILENLSKTYVNSELKMATHEVASYEIIAISICFLGIPIIFLMLFLYCLKCVDKLYYEWDEVSKKSVIDYKEAPRILNPPSDVVKKWRQRFVEIFSDFEDNGKENNGKENNGENGEEKRKKINVNWEKSTNIVQSVLNFSTVIYTITITLYLLSCSDFTLKMLTRNSTAVIDNNDTSN